MKNKEYLKSLPEPIGGSFVLPLGIFNNRVANGFSAIKKF